MTQDLAVTVPWGFLTNYALVLMQISHKADSTGLEIATAVGITERATRRILVDLQSAGYIEREKVGRRNRYRVDPLRPLVRIGDRDLTVGQLLDLVQGPSAATATPPAGRAEPAAPGAAAGSAEVTSEG